mmetsp:Transcript_3664/g.9724  ORF Transcript_3664/g.9724 Transcript_3664/m.9724 type:complete len:218 (-) Transcript_3664:271-924(-)
MGDEDEERVLPTEYSLVPEGGEKKLPTSTGFTGRAVASYTNGDVYEGPFENGIRQGQGKYTYFSGDVFTGTFENNLKTGKGRVVYKKGGFYHGFFKDGVRDGEGTFKYANGDIYSGLWKGGKRQGPGTYVFAVTKYEYKGEWKDGQITEGTWTLTDGTQYEGRFKDQKPCGAGVWRTRQGTVVSGTHTQEVVPVQAPLPATATRTSWTTAGMAAAAA